MKLHKTGTAEYNNFQRHVSNEQKIPAFVCQVGAAIKQGRD